MRSVGLLVALTLTAGLLGSPAVADPDHGSTADRKSRKQELDKQVAALREDLEGTSDDLVDAAVALEKAQADLVDAQATLTTARGALVDAQRHDAAVGARLAVARAAVGKATRELTAREAREDATRGRLGSIAREAYVSSGLAGLSIALDAESPSQFADRVNVAGTALRRQNGAIAELEVQQVETRARRARLAAAQAQVAVLKEQSEQALAARDRAADAAQAASGQVQAIVATRQHSVATIASRKRAEQKRLATLTKQQNQLADLLRGRRGGGTFNNGSGRLSYPVQAPVTSGFGMRYHPILHYYRLHAGTDFGAACGTPVHAAAPGDIVRAGWAGGFGNQVVVDHGRMKGARVASSYNHLSRIVVHGGHVARGQVIGYSGTTGLSTGCHLHFEVYVNGTHVNPMGWL